MMNTAEAAGAAGTLDMKYVLTCVLLMALVTYIPRVLPVTIFRKQIRSKFIRSFLDYTPYAVLGALTFPDVFTSTGHLYSRAATPSPTHPGTFSVPERMPFCWPPPNRIGRILTPSRI